MEDERKVTLKKKKIALQALGCYDEMADNCSVTYGDTFENSIQVSRTILDGELVGIKT